MCPNKKISQDSARLTASALATALSISGESENGPLPDGFTCLPTDFNFSRRQKSLLIAAVNPWACEHFGKNNNVKNHRPTSPFQRNGLALGGRKDDAGGDL